MTDVYNDTPSHLVMMKYWIYEIVYPIQSIVLRITIFKVAICSGSAEMIILGWSTCLNYWNLAEIRM